MNWRFEDPYFSRKVEDELEAAQSPMIVVLRIHEDHLEPAGFVYDTLCGYIGQKEIQHDRSFIDARLDAINRVKEKFIETGDAQMEVIE